MPNPMDPRPMTATRSDTLTCCIDLSLFRHVKRFETGAMPARSAAASSGRRKTVNERLLEAGAIVERSLRHSYAVFDALNFAMQAEKHIVPSKTRELYGMMLRSALLAAALASICLFALEPL